MNTKNLFCAALLFLAVACATTPKARASFDGVDTFGSSRVTESDINSRYGRQIAALADLDEKNSDVFVPAMKAIQDGIKQDFGLAFVQLSIINYFQPNPGRYLTIDMVEPQDVKERMPFLPAPIGHYEDPDGVIALWDEYQKLSFSLLGSGHFEYPKGCPVWHCLMGFEDPRLAPYLPRIDALARKNETKLAKILKDDARGNFRGNAAFLLAHFQSGKAVVKYMLPAIFDSESLVRNNAIRVLTEIAEKHPEISFPVDPIVKAVHFPTATDRNKSGYVLASLSKKLETRATILKGAGWVLFDMLKLKQPNNHDPAYQTLKNLSGKNYGDRDYDAWEAWIENEVGPR